MVAVHALDQVSSTEERREGNEPLAIIGIGCRFPGAKDVNAFWNMLCSGMDAITEVPADRFDIDALYDPRPATPGKIVSRWGGFLEDLSAFDAAFFGISPREATTLDPQTRLLLQVAWEALEDAGEVLEHLAGSQTGLFVGQTYNDYLDLQLRATQDISVYALSGGSRSTVSGRVSSLLDLRGPSLTIDTACSSSLVATHLACQSLRNGECQVALAAGVNLLLQPEITVGFSQASMLAPDGRCKAFDARANGFVRSEGIAVLVLKPLSQAQADGNPIYAVVRGSAMGNDGSSSGSYMTPGSKGQEQVIRNAYSIAGIVPGQVSYIEAHGTGTSVGDPTEVAALSAVLQEGRSPGERCLLGSVKTNIGHTEAAAGLAGVIKTALSLKHRLIPPTIHVQQPNPRIPWPTTPFTIADHLQPWPESHGPAIAGVSSFGISGTNAHVVLEEAPPHQAILPEKAALQPQAQLLTLSARSAASLTSLAQRYKEQLTAVTADQTARLQDICYSASVRRTHHDHRLAVVGSSSEELIAGLDGFLAETASPSVLHGRCQPEAPHKIVLVFPGQGSQWFGMGRRLLQQEPVFRAALERCEAAFKPYVTWSLLAALTTHDETLSGLQAIDQIQPLIFALQVALAALWRSWGMVPDAVIGHSMGEVAAAHVAGILSLEDAARIICLRSQLLKRVSGQGAMAVVGLPLADAQRAISGYEDRLATAVSNSPTTTVLSGETAALEEVLTRFQRRTIFCRYIKVDVASHSPQMDGLLEELQAVLQGIQPQPATIPLYSTVTRSLIDGTLCDATYWARNLREPVLFAQSIQQLLDNQHDVFLEISPHPILVGPTQQCLQSFNRSGLVLASLRRDEDERSMLLATLAALYTHGVPIPWRQLYPRGGNMVPLPTYPWQEEHYWFAADPAGRALRQQAGKRLLSDGTVAHPLLQHYMHLASRLHTHCWETQVTMESFAYLMDHQVQESSVFPAAAYIEIALAAAREVFGDRALLIEQIAFQQALFLSTEQATRLQVMLTTRESDAASFEVYSIGGDAHTPEASMLHANGVINVHAARQSKPPEHLELAQLQQRCLEEMSGEEHYQRMQRRGLAYGPCFQGVEHIWSGDHEALARLRPLHQLVQENRAGLVHPALLDACFQVLAATIQLPAQAESHTYLPVSLATYAVAELPSATDALWSYARLCSGNGTDADTLEGDVFLLDATGKVLISALGLELKGLDQPLPGAKPQERNDWYFEIQWEETPSLHRSHAQQPVITDKQGCWLLLSDQEGVGDRLAKLLEERGEHCIRVSPGTSYRRCSATSYELSPNALEDVQSLLRELYREGQPPVEKIVHLWSLAVSPSTISEERLLHAQEVGCISVMHLLQSLSSLQPQHWPQLTLVTRGAQPAGPLTEATISPLHAPLWGVGRVLFYEHPQLRCRLLDLSMESSDAEIAALCHDLYSERQEVQVALRGAQRYVARLLPRVPAIEQASVDSEERQRIVVAADHPYRLEIATPGLLETLVLRETGRPMPGPGAVEIQVAAAGLNFHDIMLAMGIEIGEVYDGPIPLGRECAGVVTALGEGVVDLQVGDAVMAFAPFSLGRYVITPACLVVPKPDRLSFEEAATIPTTFITAYYALHTLAHIAPRERVLIHSASGGVGLAAIQLAQVAGAEIFATAGTPEKRAFLRSLGVQHVMDSRSLAFAKEVMALTDQRGVDIVLNSLAGEALSKSLTLLSPYGRFLEIGKRNIFQGSQLGMQVFQRGVAFFSIDINYMEQHHAELLGQQFREAVALFETSNLQPLPSTHFPIGDVTHAFRTMAQGRHIGKIVIDLHTEAMQVVEAQSQTPALFKADATYLITGGLGGLGLKLADWMVHQGARHLVLVGRSKASAAAQQAIATMQQRGAQIITAQADVTQREQVANVLQMIAASCPPLRGIFHGAAILDDRTFLQLDRQRFLNVTAPKILGAWHLHQLTQQLPLDYFVLFSSAAGVVGSPGQSNYSAGNVFLDALAHTRHAQHLPALSIDWGVWGQAGLAAAQANRGQRLSQRGFAALAPEQGLLALEQLLRQEVTQVTIAPFDLEQWCQFYPIASTSAFFAYLLTTDKHAPARNNNHDSKASMRNTILTAVADERLELVASHLSSLVSKVLGFTQTKVDRQQSLHRLGIDSLMAVELKNALERDLGLVLPVTALLKGPTLHQLAQDLLEQLSAEPDEQSSAPLLEPVLTTTEDEVSQLSDQQVDELLARDEPDLTFIPCARERH